jgi:hypothetical protein
LDLNPATARLTTIIPFPIYRSRAKVSRHYPVLDLAKPAEIIARGRKIVVAQELPRRTDFEVVNGGTRVDPRLKAFYQPFCHTPMFFGSHCLSGSYTVISGGQLCVPPHMGRTDGITACSVTDLQSKKAIAGLSGDEKEPQIPGDCRDIREWRPGNGGIEVRGLA